MSHTPTPWTIGHHFPDAVYNGDRSRGIAECCDERLPFDNVTTGEHEVNRANAAFIVLAVNAHEALVATLEAVAQVYIQPTDVVARWEEIADRFHRETGFLRPGKDSPTDDGDTYDKRVAAWKAWVIANRERLSAQIVAALKLARGDA